MNALTINDVQHFRNGLMRWFNNGNFVPSDLIDGGRLNILLTAIFTDENLYVLDEDFNQMTIAEVEELVQNQNNK